MTLPSRPVQPFPFPDFLIKSNKSECRLSVTNKFEINWEFDGEKARGDETETLWDFVLFEFE